MKFLAVFPVLRVGCLGSHYLASSRLQTATKTSKFALGECENPLASHIHVLDLSFHSSRHYMLSSASLWSAKVMSHDFELCRAVCACCVCFRKPFHLPRSRIAVRSRVKVGPRSKLTVAEHPRDVDDVVCMCVPSRLCLG
jgi:hypothetical protein